MAKRPHPENTRRKPEAWHAQNLKQEADELLNAILVLCEWETDWAVEEVQESMSE